MCFLSSKIEGTCLRYMCDMHAHGPSPQMHVQQNPTKREMSFPGYVVKKVRNCVFETTTKERSVTDFMMFIHDFLHFK